MYAKTEINNGVFCMKTYILSVLFLVLATVSLNIHATENYGMSVISRDASVEKEILRLYNRQVNNLESLLNQKISAQSALSEAASEDLVLVKSGKLAGADFTTYLLTVKAGKSVLGHLSVLYYSDLSEEEVGLSTRIYLNDFVK